MENDRRENIDYSKVQRGYIYIECGDHIPFPKGYFGSATTCEMTEEEKERKRLLIESNYLKEANDRLKSDIEEAKRRKRVEKERKKKFDEMGQRYIDKKNRKPEKKCDEDDLQLCHSTLLHLRLFIGSLGKKRVEEDDVLNCHSKEAHWASNYNSPQKKSLVERVREYEAAEEKYNKYRESWPKDAVHKFCLEILKYECDIREMIAFDHHCEVENDAFNGVFSERCSEFVDSFERYKATGDFRDETDKLRETVEMQAKYIAALQDQMSVLAEMIDKANDS